MWFSVRHLLCAAAPGTDGLAIYEERLTIWNSGSFDTAYASARAEAERYAGSLRDGSVLPLFHVFRLFDDPGATFPRPTSEDIFSSAGHGAEVFSLMRESDLDPEKFVERFFSLGVELESGRARTFEE